MLLHAVGGLCVPQPVPLAASPTSFGLSGVGFDQSCIEWMKVVDARAAACVFLFPCELSTFSRDNVTIPSRTRSYNDSLVERVLVRFIVAPQRANHAWILRIVGPFES